MMELALRLRDTDREYYAGLDKCIANDSSLDIATLMPGGLNRSQEFDNRILHLPVLWKKYHNRLRTDRHGSGSSFWIANIREATQKRLAVSCGEIHKGYSVDSVKSVWDKDTIEQESDSWNEDVMMDTNTSGEFLGGEEHWAKFSVL
jgi:hypothetical protein